jgi:hypothetical protein
VADFAGRVQTTLQPVQGHEAQHFDW